MNRTESKEAAKSRLEEYLNIITTKKGNQYVCPICKSGAKNKKTPAGSLTPDRQSYHCFSCGFHGDIFNLIGQVEGIANQAEQFKKAYQIFNLQEDQNHQSNPVHADALLSELPAADFIDYYKECNARAGETDYFSFRGLSQSTVNKFMLGYCASWQSPKALREGKNPPASPRVIIPTSKYSYVARTTDRNTDPKYKSIKEGKSELFNREALWGVEPVFVVEGEFDALSILEVGGHAIALGSVSNKRKLIELCQTAPPSVPVILSLDNDEAGKKTQSEISNALSLLKTPFLEANISGGYKDPNEHLTSDSEAFRSMIEHTKIRALQFAHDFEETKQAEAAAEKTKYIKAASVTAKIDDFIGQIKASVDTPTIPTGFTELDEILDEGLYEGLYVIGAISSLGKTSFALSFATR